MSEMLLAKAALKRALDGTDCSIPEGAFEQWVKLFLSSSCAILRVWIVVAGEEHVGVLHRISEDARWRIAFGQLVQPPLHDLPKVESEIAVQWWGMLAVRMELEQEKLINDAGTLVAIAANAMAPGVGGKHNVSIEIWNENDEGFADGDDFNQMLLERKALAS